MPSKLLRLALALVIGASACGGGSAGAPSAKSAKDEAKGTEDGDPTEASDKEPALDLRKAACADGTCFSCGDGVCPKGFYCDERAPGGAACGWLPECAQSPTCACLKSGLEGCACEERSGGVFATCQ